MFYLTKFFRFPANMARHCSSKTKSNAPSIKYCADIVRQHDYENFLATLLMTNIVRSPALVVRAFNVEIARIQDQTNDSKIATMRLQFWHDTLKNIFDKKSTLRDIPANPVAQEMFKIRSSYKLPKRYLEKLITSRNQIINAKYFYNIEDIEKYSEDSVSSIYHTLLSIAAVQNIHADHVASHLGKAQGITNILRSIHVCNHQRTIMLPMEILMKHKVSQENVLRGVDSDAMRNVVYEIASRANSHLEKDPKAANWMARAATRGIWAVLDASGRSSDLSRFHTNSILSIVSRKSLPAPQSLSLLSSLQPNDFIGGARKIDIPKSTKQVFLPASSVERYLTKLEKNNFNVFDPELQKGSVLLPLKLYYKRLFNKF